MTEETLEEALRRVTKPVGEKELETYVHYDHVQILTEASRRLRLFILLRRTNPESIKYIGYAGFVPKPLACKPKTAKSDATLSVNGDRVQSACAGLVVDPFLLDRTAFENDENKRQKAQETWRKEWGGGIPAGFVVQKDPTSGYYGCVMRCQAGTRVFPSSRTFTEQETAKKIRTAPVEQPGARGFILQPDRNVNRHALESLPEGCSYIHGDYDLYALVDRRNPSVREWKESQFEGAPHKHSPEWRRFEAFVRSKINIDMVQHGSQEHFSEHSDEVVDMFCPVEASDLWVVKVTGKFELERLYATVFQGRSTA